MSQVIAGQRIGSSIPAPSSQKVTRRLFGRGGQLPVSFRFTMREFVWLVALAAFALLLYWFQAWDGPIPSDYGEMAILVVLAVAEHAWARRGRRSALHGRERHALSAGGMEVFSAALFPGKAVDLEEQRVREMIRDDVDDGAPPCGRIDLDSGVAYLDVR